MKVKLLRPVLVDHNWIPRGSGEVVDIPEDRASQYIAGGFAEATDEDAEVVLPFDPIVGTGGERRAAPMGTPSRAADEDRRAIRGTSGSTQLTGAGAGQTVETLPGAPTEPLIATHAAALPRTELAPPPLGDPAVRPPQAVVQQRVGRLLDEASRSKLGGKGRK